MNTVPHCGPRFGSPQFGLYQVRILSCRTLSNMLLSGLPLSVSIIILSAERAGSTWARSEHVVTGLFYRCTRLEIYGKYFNHALILPGIWFPRVKCSRFSFRMAMRPADATSMQQRSSPLRLRDAYHIFTNVATLGALSAVLPKS